MNNERAKELFEASFNDQDEATNSAVAAGDLQFVIAYYSGFRDAIRELFPEVDLK